MIPKNGILTLSGLLLLASVPSLFAQEPPEQVESFNLVPKKISSELLVPEAEDAPAQINLPDPDDNVTDKDFYGSDALAKAALLCAEGKPYDCAAHYKELTRSADAEESFSAYKNLGVMEYFGGRSSSAIEYLDKALSKKPSDAISNILKGWAYLSMGKNRQAIDQFNKVTSLTSNPGMVSDSRLGTALALLFDGKYKDAEKKLQALYATDPYTIAFTAYLMALANIEQGEPLTAQTYLEQSLKHDGMNYDAAKKLSTLYSDAEENLKAWQTYSTIAALEPDDPDIQNTFKKLGGKLKDDPAKFMIRTRLSSPINRLLRRTKSPELNVALYSDGNGIPARIKEFAFQASSSFTITDLTLGSISKGKRNDTWTVRFDPEKQNITVTNSWDNIEYLSGKPFRITPLGDGAGVLLKNLVGGSLIDRDYGDKEFRGELTVIPSTNGIILINNTTVEDFLPGALSPARAGTTEPETLKALAVVLRTKIT
ncbi:MAG: tetratricopeptide repeat protein, partial [Elusimicrobiaceae bacterium]